MFAIPKSKWLQWASQSPCGPLLSPEDIGITLTDGYAIQPGAAVSGWYFSHPEARDFGIGKINRR